MSSGPPAATRFDSDSAVRLVSEGVYDAHVDPGWWVVSGPNGGYLAAILVRALEASAENPVPEVRALQDWSLRMQQADAVSSADS